MVLVIVTVRKMMEKLNDNTVHECKKELVPREKDISKGINKGIFPVATH